MIRRGPGLFDPEDLANLDKGDFQIAVPDQNAIIVLEERILGNPLLVSWPLFMLLHLEWHTSPSIHLVK